MAEDRGACTKLRNPRRSVNISAELIIKTPTPNRFPKQHYFGRIIRIGNLNKDAIEQPQAIGKSLPAFFRSRSYGWPTAIHQNSLRLEHWPRPNALTFDLRVQREC